MVTPGVSEAIVKLSNEKIRKYHLATAPRLPRARAASGQGDSTPTTFYSHHGYRVRGVQGGGGKNGQTLDPSQRREFSDKLIRHRGILVRVDDVFRTNLNTS